MRNKKNLSLIIILVLILVLTLGGAYALWTYSKTLGDQTLISGEVFLKYTEGDTINMKEAMPSITYNPDEYFEFTVEGKNNYKKDIVFEILLDEGDQPTGDENKTRTERIKPELLKFRLVEIKDGQEEELIQEGSYDNLNKKRIWVDRVKANTKENIKYTYRLYMWISNDTKIGNMEGADYTAEVWNNNVYASVKVTVNGDFTEKELTEDYMILNAVNESGEPYNLKQPTQSNEDIIVTLGSKREVTKFVVSKSSEYPIALTSLPEATDYTASYNETSRSWEAKVTIEETGIYDYYAVYSDNKGQSKEYSFTVLMNPDRYVLVEKPTSALCKQGLTYTESPQELIAEENLQKEGYTIEQVQGTDANSYEVKAKLKKNFRWVDSSKEDATFNCTIGPKETELTYEPASEFKVGKGFKKIFKITASTDGTFNVTSKASGTASVEFTPAVGTSTTVTVNGVEIGLTSLDINFTPSSNNYTSKTDTYNVEVLDSQNFAITKIKGTIGKTDGIIGVTNDNLKVTTNSENIREYRYSGLGVKNYVIFNEETWRILGVFKDENGEEHVKIVRNEVLPADVMPDTYTVNEISSKIRYNNGATAYWNEPRKAGSCDNDWTVAGLKYWLNSEGTTDGYLKQLTSKAQEMIEETKWYLGNVTYYSGSINGADSDHYGIKDTPIEAYANERSGKSCSSISTNACPGGYIWPNNSATWIGKIGLMYPSDYGLSAIDSYWATKLGYGTFNGSVSDSSWLQKEVIHSSDEWLLSPSSADTRFGSFWDINGDVNFSLVNNYYGVRPTIYLKSEVEIIGGIGESGSPYQLSCSNCTVSS